MFGEALRIRGKNFKQNLAQNYSTSTKIAITACKFFRGSMPPDPPRGFFVSQSVLNLFCRKMRLKNVENHGLPLLKLFNPILGPVDPSSYSLTPIRPLGYFRPLGWSS